MGRQAHEVAIRGLSPPCGRTCSIAGADAARFAALARLEALESDNAGVEVVDLNDDEYGSTDEEDPVLMQKKQSKIMKRKTRQGKALEKKAASIHGCLTRSYLNTFSLWNYERQIWNPFLLMSQHI
ncbi:unnamed protein product [Miscanthus lutarioriparius]|uniref:Uncharacterized protein n=1 Tax=Miscanthus lutarioriparius TaxID=422564 RepID=A0A811QRL2_9POAL|nr:unnamed protein product [Miscanthus lutarioriparius]